MAIKYHNIEQGTDEWHQMRLGVVTASNINTIISPAGKPAKNEKMRNYACEIAAQRIMMVVEENFQSFDMVRGHIQEGIARDIYNDKYEGVDECGFITNDTHGFTVGCSPDGLVGDDGGIEIKSRLAKFQIGTIIADEVPKDYMNQIQAFMLVSGRDWCDFVQYSNGMPLYVKRVYPDPVRRVDILSALAEFEVQVEAVLSEYKAKSEGLVKTERVDFLNEGLISSSDEA